jgi:uncharacterized membrane-anchored protein YitT (DUF2179 family)
MSLPKKVSINFQNYIRAAGLDFSRQSLQDLIFILLGALVQALAMRLFLVPGKLVSGGISGAAQLISHYTDFPIGLMVFLGNVPLFILGWRYLGGPRFVIRTALAILTFSILTDTLVWFIPERGWVLFTEDRVPAGEVTL